MSSERVLILYNEPTLPSDHPHADSEHEIIFTVDAVEKALAENGFQVDRLGIHVDPAPLIERIKSNRPDVIFNQFEGLPDRGQTEAFAAGIMEWFGVPYTGCPFSALATARNKPLTKLILNGAGLPTPDFMLVDALPAPTCRMPWPVIVKPSNQDASVGMDQGSVVTDADAFEARVTMILEMFGPPVLVEEFIPGREFNIGVVDMPEPRVLPASEVVFVNDEGDERWPIITYNSKWKPDSRDYRCSPMNRATEVPPEWVPNLEHLVAKAYKLLGCRDYARIDLRVKPSGDPYILEVNPNPDFSPLCGLADVFEEARITHEQMCVQFVRNALARGGQPLAEPSVDKIIEWKW